MGFDDLAFIPSIKKFYPQYFQDGYLLLPAERSERCIGTIQISVFISVQLPSSFVPALALSCVIWYTYAQLNISTSFLKTANWWLLFFFLLSCKCFIYQMHSLYWNTNDMANNSYVVGRKKKVIKTSEIWAKKLQIKYKSIKRWKIFK